MSGMKLAWGVSEKDIAATRPAIASAKAARPGVRQATGALHIDEDEGTDGYRLFP
jgi:hypothetical protein